MRRRACPCRYLASASPCAAMTTCSFSASAFSTAATLRANYSKSHMVSAIMRLQYLSQVHGAKTTPS